MYSYLGDKIICLYDSYCTAGKCAFTFLVSEVIVLIDDNAHDDYWERRRSVSLDTFLQTAWTGFQYVCTVYSK